MERGQNNHLRTGTDLFNSTRGLHAIHARHDQVHKHDIRDVLLNNFYGFFTGGGLSDHTIIREGIKIRTEAFSDDFVIIHD
jgi:hypothetical protein